MNRKNRRWVFVTTILAALLSGSPVWGKLVPTPDVNRFFVTPGKQATLTWTKENTTNSPPAQSFHYQICNYWNKLVLSGRTMTSPKGQVAAQVKLPRGFYTITFPSLHQTFGIDSIPAYIGEPDPFFCIDAALSQRVLNFSLSWVPNKYKHFDTVRAALIRILKRSGISTARERWNLNRINSEQGQFYWQTRWHYNLVRQTYQRNGVGVLELFDRHLGYLKHLGNARGFPRNMLGTAEALLHIARHWRPAWAGLEIWNEPNNYPSPYPADQYASMVKAISYALHQKYPDLPIGGPAMSRIRLGSMTFFREAARCGVLNVMNFWSIHTYWYVNQMQEKIRVWRHALAQEGHPHMPLWITETGSTWKPGGISHPRPPMASSQQDALADTMRGVEARACGIARYFPFLYVYFTIHGGPQNYGMMGKMATPLRPFVAYAQAVYALSHKTYIGDLRYSNPAIKRARVFAKGNQTVIVIYTGQAKRNASVPFKIKPMQVRGIDGRLLKVQTPGRIPIPDGLSYVYVSRTALSDKLNTHTTAMHLYKMGHTPARSVVASPLVLQFLPDTKLLKLYKAAYLVKRTDHLALFPVTIRVINLGKHSCTVNVALTRTADHNQHIPMASPHTLTINSKSQCATTFMVNLSGNDLPGKIYLRATAKLVKSQEPSSAIQPEVIPLHIPTSLSAMLKRYPRHRRLTIDQFNQWHPQHSQVAKRSFSSNHGVWTLTVNKVKTHPDSRPWSLPVLQLKNSNKTGLKNVMGVIVRGRCTSKQAKCGLFYITQPSHVRVISPWRILPLFPSDGKWHTVFVPFNRLVSLIRNNVKLQEHQRAALKGIQIGMRLPKKLRSPATLQISDLYLVLRQA